VEALVKFASAWQAGEWSFCNAGETAMDEANAKTVTPKPRVFAPNAVQMLRTAQASTLTLSQMADQKASILMGATFVVFSLSVSRALAQEGDLPWSLSVLAAFAFLSALCGVSAVLPSVKSPKPDPTFVPNKLFFGHFAHRDEEEWTRDVLADLENEEQMFRIMLHDLYQNGQILQRKKYRFLGYAYRIFIFGLFATMATFVLELATKY